VDFSGDFGLRDTFQKRIAPKSIEIDKDKLHIKSHRKEDEASRNWCKRREKGK